MSEKDTVRYEFDKSLKVILHDVIELDASEKGYFFITNKETNSQFGMKLGHSILKKFKTDIFPMYADILRFMDKDTLLEYYKLVKRLNEWLKKVVDNAKNDNDIINAIRDKRDFYKFLELCIRVSKEWTKKFYEEHPEFQLESSEGYEVNFEDKDFIALVELAAVMRLLIPLIHDAYFYHTRRKDKLPALLGCILDELFKTHKKLFGDDWHNAISKVYQLFQRYVYQSNIYGRESMWTYLQTQMRTPEWHLSEIQSSFLLKILITMVPNTNIVGFIVAYNRESLSILFRDTYKLDVRYVSSDYTKLVFNPRYDLLNAITTRISLDIICDYADEILEKLINIYGREKARYGGCEHFVLLTSHKRYRKPNPAIKYVIIPYITKVFHTSYSYISGYKRFESLMFATSILLYHTYNFKYLARLCRSVPVESHKIKKGISDRNLKLIKSLQKYYDDIFTLEVVKHIVNDMMSSKYYDPITNLVWQPDVHLTAEYVMFLDRYFSDNLKTEILVTHNGIKEIFELYLQHPQPLVEDYGAQLTF